jgi:hypothetical protein
VIVVNNPAIGVITWELAPKTESNLASLSAEKRQILEEFAQSQFTILAVILTASFSGWPAFIGQLNKALTPMIDQLKAEEAQARGQTDQPD